MDKNEKILAKLAGREEDVHCADCDKSFYKEECDKSPEKGLTILGHTSFLCPNCNERTKWKRSRLVKMWSKHYFQQTRGKWKIRNDIS